MSIEPLNVGDRVRVTDTGVVREYIAGGLYVVKLDYGLWSTLEADRLTRIDAPPEPEKPSEEPWLSAEWLRQTKVQIETARAIGPIWPVHRQAEKMLAEIERLNSEATNHRDELLDMRMQRDAVLAEIDGMKSTWIAPNEYDSEQVERFRRELVGVTANRDHLVECLRLRTNAITEMRAKFLGTVAIAEDGRDQALAALSVRTKALERIVNNADVSRRLHILPLIAVEMRQIASAALYDPAIAAEAARIRLLEEENAEFRKLIAEKLAALDAEMKP